ncbi:MAG TPA: type II toxin-antitoxin system RelB/DinJ family antitoxin [Desulfuromonadales bacterium]|nr:type II toxin-antitoxin system RelB/DinJ family antitoxin [Desulfuromonadales bacterium]
MSETIIRARVDELEKLECESIFKNLGLTMSEAVRLFIRQVNTVKGLPFELKLNATAAIEHDRWFREHVESVLAKMNQPGRVSTSHEDVGTRLKAKQAALLKKAA